MVSAACCVLMHWENEQYLDTPERAVLRHVCAYPSSLLSSTLLVLARTRSHRKQCNNNNKAARHKLAAKVSQRLESRIDPSTRTPLDERQRRHLPSMRFPTSKSYSQEAKQKRQPLPLALHKLVARVRLRRDVASRNPTSALGAGKLGDRLPLLSPIKNLGIQDACPPTRSRCLMSEYRCTRARCESEWNLELETISCACACAYVCAIVYDTGSYRERGRRVRSLECGTSSRWLGQRRMSKNVEKWWRSGKKTTKAGDGNGKLEAGSWKRERWRNVLSRPPRKGLLPPTFILHSVLPILCTRSPPFPHLQVSRLSTIMYRY